MRLLRVTLIPFALLALTFAGCKQEDEIATETIEHKDREPIRLRVAIMEKGDAVWFIRLSGPVDLVKANEAAYEELVKSVKFEADKDPTWTEPKGWKKDPRGGERFANYRIAGQPKEVEVFVTKLSAKGYDLIKNMHRWQKQVNVPLTEKHADLKPPEVIVDKIGGQEVTWIDLRGLGVHAVSKPPEPVAANQKKIFPGIPMKKAVGGGAGGPGGGGAMPFKYTVPAGWAKKAPGQFAAEAYSIGDKVNVTLTPAGGDVGANINRWRGQVGMPEAGPDELKKTISELPIAGIKNFYVDLAAEKGAPDRIRIVGAIIPAGKTLWFIKMTGPNDAVGEQKAAFETFMKSFKMDGR